MTKIVNLTPHTVNIRGIEYPSQGVARVSATEKVVGNIFQPCSVHYDDHECGCSPCEIPVVSQKLGEVENLPSPENGTIFIVSRMVAVACQDRKDLYVPSRLVRDEKGLIVGCNALERV